VSRARLCYGSLMTKLLEKAITKIRDLPADRQDALAEMMLEFVEHPESLLTDEQWKEVELSLQEADEGKFATKEEVAALWKKFGL